MERPCRLEKAARRMSEKRGHVVGQRDVIELGLLFQDGHARVELGAQDVDDEAPLEAGLESIL
jgi:hypothetical protein